MSAGNWWSTAHYESVAGRAQFEAHLMSFGNGNSARLGGNNVTVWRGGNVISGRRWVLRNGDNTLSGNCGYETYACTRAPATGIGISKSKYHPRFVMLAVGNKLMAPASKRRGGARRYAGGCATMRRRSVQRMRMGAMSPLSCKST